jgi:hypothetical protein
MVGAAEFFRVLSCPNYLYGEPYRPAIVPLHESTIWGTLWGRIYSSIGTSSTVQDALPNYLTEVSWNMHFFYCIQSFTYIQVLYSNSQKLSISKIFMKLNAYYQYRNPAPSRILKHYLRFRWHPHQRIAGRFSKNKRGIIFKKPSLGTEV